MKKSIVGISIVTSMLLAESFTLGQVSVSENVEELNPIEQSITSNVIAQNNSATVSEALDNLSGVNQDIQGGRGESTLYIRGFDAKRVGVFIDGIPIYVPYDGNFDYGRFLTADIGQIDVSKGYSSVMYGGNTMGGVVNIVSKKPTKELEGNIKGGIVLDSSGTMSRHVESVNVGTKQNNFYAQLGAVYSKQDHFKLSNDYDATLYQADGERLRSEAQDKKISLKAGYIANDKSEVAVSYANQKGVKQQPPATDLNYSQLKYWDWPIWDKETFSVTGQKNFENSYLKALAYYDTSTSSLFAYDSATFATMSKASSFKSRYQDHSVGARLEYGIALGDNFVKAAANYKKDVHEGYDLNKVTEAKTLTETYEDHTITLGLEDSYKISSHWELLGGVSYDTRTADKIFDTNTANLDMLDLKTQSSFSPEAALIYSPDESSKVRGSISRKTYMPSMKDRYSRKFNKYVPNVDLKNELSTHYELSYQKQLNAFVGQTNLFYTKVDDAIQSVSWNQNPALLQNQNVGTFEHKGIELELSYKQDGLEVGGNYTHIAIENRSDSAVKIVDVPKNQIFVYAQKEVGAGFSLYANAKYRNGAYELNNKNDFNAANDTYDINPDFTTFDVKAIYEPTKAITAEIGIKNLTDELVKYDMAFPMAGREFFANLEYKF